MREILVATDGSAGADRAVAFAARLAVAFQAPLRILTVQGPVPLDVVNEMKAVEHVGEAEVAELTAHSTLVRAQRLAATAGTAVIHTVCEIGDPTQKILDTATSRKVEAVVVGKRGRGPLAALLLGSVSQKLVSLAPCSVIVVP